MDRKIIGYYSCAQQLGGGEIYLKSILDTIDYQKYRVILFCLHDYFTCDMLQKRKKDIQIVYLNETADLKDKKIKESKKKIINISKDLLKRPIPFSVKLFLGMARDVLRLKKLFSKNRVDLFHSNHAGCEPVIIAAKLAGIPIIIGTYHTMPSCNIKKHNLVRRMMENISTRYLDIGIAVSNATKNAWIKRTGIKSENIEVIYNGINLSKFNNNGFDQDILKKELGIDKSCPTVGMPARLDQMKGHRNLIEAVLEVKKEFPNVKILLAGDGNLRQELENKVKSLNLGGTVQFLGHRDDIIDLIFLFDIVTLPSEWEALGFALLEAMACNKPVIASNIGGIPEVVENGVTGMLIPPRDSKSLAKAIIELLKDKDKARRMGKAGRKRIEKHFSQDIMLKKTFYLYERLLNENRD